MSDEVQNQEAVVSPTVDTAETPLAPTEPTAVQTVPEIAPVQDNSSTVATPTETSNAVNSAPAVNEPSSTPALAATREEKFTANMLNWKQHLAEAMAKRAQRKQTRLDKVLALAQNQPSITNKQVKKLLRCTKLTAWRYLKTLEKQNKLKRTGGHNTPTYEIIK